MRHYKNDNSNALIMLDICLRTLVDRTTSILFKVELPHKSLSLSKVVFYMWWQTETDILNVFLPHTWMRERNPAIHSAATLNQKNRPPAFWMISEPELPSLSNSNEAFLLRHLEHQEVVEPWDLNKDSLFPVSHLAHYLPFHACGGKKESLRILTFYMQLILKKWQKFDRSNQWGMFQL